jgi:hypothetical protein
VAPDIFYGPLCDLAQHVMDKSSLASTHVDADKAEILALGEDDFY